MPWKTVLYYCPTVWSTLFLLLQYLEIVVDYNGFSRWVVKGAPVVNLQRCNDGWVRQGHPPELGPHSSISTHLDFFLKCSNSQNYLPPPSSHRCTSHNYRPEYLKPSFLYLKTPNRIPFLFLTLFKLSLSLMSYFWFIRLLYTLSCREFNDTSTYTGLYSKSCHYL